MTTRVGSHMNRCLLALALLLPLPASAPAEMWYGPTPYLQSSNSPFSGLSFAWFHLEDFDDAIWTPGWTLDHGNVSSKVAISGGIDSVGGSGDAWCVTNYTGVTFSFLTDELPSLPTEAGIVWTDGYGLTKFEAFDLSGASLGAIVADLGVEDEYSGQTTEDRFFGVSYLGGIGSIRITVAQTSTSVGFIEVDHLQYGVAVVPLPGAVLLGMLGLGYTGMRLRRHP